MTRETTIRAIGNSAGMTIPKAMLERYRMAEGDRVHLVETEEGSSAKEPITTAFSKDVGRILAEMPPGSNARRTDHPGARNGPWPVFHLIG